MVSGLSGAGKTTAIGLLEDLGYFCMDNIPTALIEEMTRLLMSSTIEKFAIVVDIRSEIFGDPVEKIKRLKDKLKARVIFLEASKEEILRRYALTRRKHPLQNGMNLEKAIEIEREKLMSLKEIADHVIDTSRLNAHQLREKLLSILKAEWEEGIIRIMSFGYKFGIPMDADFVFDARFFPNPHYHPNLSHKTGLDEEVKEFFKEYPQVEEYVKSIVKIVLTAFHEYSKEGRKSLTVAIGCTGGQHRSVYIARRIAEEISKTGISILEEHRDLGKGIE